MANVKIVQGSRHVKPIAYPPGRVPEQWVPGDVLLTHTPYGMFSEVIRSGERLRYWSKDDQHYAWFNHAAVVVRADSRGNAQVAEALPDGIKINPASNFLKPWFAYIDIGADEDDRNHIVDFAEREASLKGEYGKLQLVSIAGSLLTKGRLRVGIDGSEICSGLVAKALRGAGYWWEQKDGDASYILDEGYLSPADLAASFHTEQIRSMDHVLAGV